MKNKYSSNNIQNRTVCIIKIRFLLIAFIFVIFATSSHSQSYKMLRVEYNNASSFHSGVCTNPNGIDGPNYTTNSSLNTLLGSYNVSYYAPYYSNGVLDSTLNNYYAVYLGGNIDSFVSDLESLSLTSDIEILNPDTSLCSSPVQIYDEHLVQGWMNNYMLELTDAQCAWTITTGNPNIRLAIVDTDFELTHEDLVNRIREVYGPITSEEEHGTTVMGAAGAEPNNKGVVGIGYNLVWDGARVPHSGGSGYPSVGLKNAVDKGARVISLSWSGTGYSRNAMQDLVNRGFSIIVSAGNSPQSEGHNDYSDIPGVIVVSGVDKDGYHGTTNHARNSGVDLCALSKNISTTKNGNSYSGFDGTSYAAPQVAAAAGLILSLNQCFTPVQIEYILKKTTKPVHDASTYPGLVGTGYLDVYSALKYAAGRSGNLTSNETWTTTEIISGNLIIPTGFTLTIKSNVWCYADAAITVNPGGRLLIDGGNLFSICETWKGIRVEGTSSQNQVNLAYVGFLELKDAIIADAQNAVSLIGLQPGGGLDWSKTGGLVQATNSDFVNNKRDVEFMSYHPKSNTGLEQPNRSYFNNCKFITNNSLKFWNNGFPHVTMWDVNGIKFLGCSFENNRSYIDKKNPLARIGIYTINSTYTVNSLCNNPFEIPCNTIPTQFLNLHKAIESYSNGTTGVITIENSQFNSYKGAFLQGTDGSTARNNIFTIEHDIVNTGLTNYPFGLYLDKCQRFNTEGNQFTGTTGATNVSNGGAAGLVIRNTGPNNNIFYRSNFDNLKMASQALSENRDIDIIRGLTFRCNYYEETWNDLDVRNDPNNPATNGGFLGMKELQGQNTGGSPTTPDNHFANSSSILNFNIENNANYMQYIYTGSAIQANELFPYVVTGNVLPLQFSGTTSGCPNLIHNWGTERELLIEKLDNLKPLMMAKLNQVKALTNGGNTTDLKEVILNADGTNVGNVIAQLIAFSPWLSNEILAQLADQNAPFTHEMIRDIMIANPHSARCLWINQTLDARTYPLSQNYREQISELLNVYTQRDTLGAELSALTEEYDFTLHELLYSYEADTNAIIEDYKHLMKHPSNPIYHYQLAEKYFNQNDWTNFELVKDSIPLKFLLNERQAAYHTSFSAFYEELYNWQQSSGSPYEPDSAKLDWLLSFVNTHNEYPARIHALLAVNDTFIIQPDVYIPEESGSNAPAMELIIETLKQENKNSQINLYPNPAKYFITLEWKTNAKTAYVHVTDLQGKIITQQYWDGKEKCNLVTDNWQNGIYFVKVLSNDNNAIIVRKVVINK